MEKLSSPDRDDDPTAITLVHEPVHLADQFARSNSSLTSTANATAHPGVVQQGQRKRFSDETELLLRGRLKAAAINLVLVLGLGYAGNLLANSSQWFIFRTIILVVVAVSYGLLRSKATLEMRSLRIIELLMFGGVAIQMSLMMYSRTEFFASQGDATSMVGVQQFFFTAFCLHILTYGIFMPNTWKRAAVVTVALACIPYGIQFFQEYSDPEIARLLAMNKGHSPLPVTLVAALIGSFGSHIINRTRREAFRAKQIMQYRLQEKIGSGGMGDVYRAEHVLLKRRCAMKLIKPEKGRDASTLASFEREVIATARLSHWNTIEIYDYGHTDDGTFYYVMELLEGENLQTLVEKHGPLPPGRVVYLLAQACDALHEAHEAGLIHRDIKPANIFAARRGGSWDVAKLLDFGLVREIATEEPGEPRKSLFSGTPMFMAPEQVTKYDHVDGRSDIYAIGAVAYLLLTGVPPFKGSKVMDILRAHASTPVIKPREILPNIPADLERVVLMCLQKEPEDRFATAQSLSESLRECECAKDWNAYAAATWWNTRAKDHP